MVYTRTFIRDEIKQEKKTIKRNSQLKDTQKNKKQAAPRPTK